MLKKISFISLILVYLFSILSFGSSAMNKERTKWTNEETQHLMDLVKSYQEKNIKINWVNILNEFPGRTSQQIKRKQYNQENKDQITKYKKQYYQENKDQMIKYNKQYAQKNKEKISKYRKQYDQENKDQMTKYNKQYYKQYYQKNKDQMTKYNKQYYQENKDQITKYKKEYAQKNKDQMTKYHKQYYQEKKSKIACQQKSDIALHTDEIDAFTFVSNKDLENQIPLYIPRNQGEVLLGDQSSKNCNKACREEKSFLNQSYDDIYEDELDSPILLVDED